MKQHIYRRLASQRCKLGLSQQALAARAGLRREKLNRIESKGEDIGLDDLCRLLDAAGLELDVREKAKAPSSARAARPRAPQDFRKASFIDGSRAKILDWGKLPR